ncbi:MAG: hypothetical protein WD250_00270 [Egibacteraceae bacterium]
MKNRAPLIGALVAVVLVAGFWFLLYKPAMEEQAAFESATAELESQQGQLAAEIAQLEAIREDADHYRAVVALQEEFLPTGVAQPDVIRQFQRTADAAGVDITAVSFEQPVIVEGAPDTGDPTTTLASIAVNMVTEGGYFPTVDFFRRLEQDVPRAVLTQSVNLAEGAEGFPSLATTWAGQLFAVLPVAATVAPDAPGATPSTPGENGGAEEGGPEGQDPGATAQGDQEDTPS